MNVVKYVNNKIVRSVRNFVIILIYKTVLIHSAADKAVLVHRIRVVCVLRSMGKCTETHTYSNTFVSQQS